MFLVAILFRDFFCFKRLNKVMDVLAWNLTSGLAYGTGSIDEKKTLSWIEPRESE